MPDDAYVPCCSAGRTATGDRTAASRKSTETTRNARATTPTQPDETTPEPASTKLMVELPGRTFRMGTDDNMGFPADGEGPSREVTVDPFYIDQHAVTNAEFLQFVRETNYTTDAQRFGWSFIFKGFVEYGDYQRVPEAPWWIVVEDASWFRPRGPNSSIVNEDYLTHPVVHVSWHDAVAYANWAGKRLPTEAEWEYAARGGLSGKRYAWGDELKPGDNHRCNIWQGEFPTYNTAEDGYYGTAPVNEYPSNGYGLYNVAGNVWEWCADWFSPNYHTTDSYELMNPVGPPQGTERVMRGGSYLCHHSYCNRYRVAARSKNTPDSSTGNIGFRCVMDAN